MTFSFAPPTHAQESQPALDQSQLGDLYLRSGRWEEAREVFARLAEEPNAPASVFRGLGEASLQLGDKAAAIRAFERAAEKEGDPKTVLQLVALLTPDRKNWPRATEILQRYLGANPGDGNARRRLAELLIYQGRSREALPDLARAVEAKPDDAELRLIYARALVWNGQGKEAYAQFERAIAGGPAIGGDDIKWFAEAAEAAGNLEAAKGAFDSFLESHPDDVDALSGVVRTAEALRRNAEAGDLSKRTDLLSVRAGIAFSKGDLAAAEADYRAALKVNPRQAQALSGLTRIALARRDSTAAEAHLRELARVSPREARALRDEVDLQQALARLEATRTPESDRAAEALLRKALARNPSRVDVRLRLAQVLERQARYDEALGLYLGLERETPPIEEAYAGPVRIYLKQGEQDLAKESLGRLEQIFPAGKQSFEASLHVARAEERKRAGDYVEAIKEYGEALKLRPDRPDLLMGLAGVYFAVGQLENALQAFRAAAAADPKNAEAIRGQVSVLAQLASTNPSAARDYAEQALAASGDSEDALLRVIEIAIASESWDVAERAVKRISDAGVRLRLLDLALAERQLAPWRKAPIGMNPLKVLTVAEMGLKAAPGRNDLLVVRAQALEQAGQLPQALAAYRALETAPGAPEEALAGQVRLLARLGRWQEADRTLAELGKRSPATAELAERSLRLAEIVRLKDTGKKAEALAAASRVKARWWKDYDVLVSIGGVHLDLGNANEALADYEAALAERPRDPIARRGRAAALAARGDLEEAGRAYGELLAEFPDDPATRRVRVGIWITLAGRALAAERTEEADRALDNALVLDPQSQAALEMKIQAAFARQDWATAKMLAARLPNRGAARRYEALVGVEEKLAPWRDTSETLAPEKALEIIRAGRAIAPNRIAYRIDEARATELKGDLPKALALYRALAAEPDQNAEAYAGQISVLMELQRFDDAEAVIVEFSRRHPEAGNEARARLMRAEALAYKKAERLSNAIEAAREALVYAPNDADTLTVLGGIYAQAGDFKSARKAYEAALELKTDDPTALAGLAGAYEALGDWEAAEATYRRFATVPGQRPPPGTWKLNIRHDLARARVLAEQGRVAEAQAMLERARAASPRDPDVWAAMAEVTLRLRQKTLALAYADQGLALAPHSPRLIAARIRVLAGLDRYEEAVRAITASRNDLGAEGSAVLARELEKQRQRAERERLTREGRLDQVYLLLARQYQANPSDADVLKAIGYLYLRTKQYGDSERFFREAEILTPDDPDVQIGIAYAMRGKGDSRGAAKILEAIYAKRPNADIALALAEVYHDLGRDDDAQQILRSDRRTVVERSMGTGMPPLVLDRDGGAYDAVPESVLPPLKLPSGNLRAVPGGESSVLPDRRGETRPARADARPAVEMPVVLSDAVPPVAALFGGVAGLGALREPVQIAEEIPSFDQLMDDVHGRSPAATPGARKPTPPAPSETPPFTPIPEPTPTAKAKRSKAAPEPRATPLPEPTLLPPAPPEPGIRLEYERPDEAPAAAAPIPHPPPGRDVLSPEARLRAEALDREIQRRRQTKVGFGLRYDFLNSVSDVDADQFAVWRLPVYIDFAGPQLSRFRVTAEPTFVDNGRISDSGFAARGEWRDLKLVTDLVQATIGGGIVHAGFPEGPQGVGFGRLDVNPRPHLNFGPFAERVPVMESLTSYRGNSVVTDNGRRVFFGQVMQNRFGGNLSFDPPDAIGGTVEAAYSNLEGIRVDDNDKLDVFVGLGRTFPLSNDFAIRPGVQFVFFHYEKDLSEAFPPGGGYFSPDSFVEVTGRLAFTGPLLPDALPGSTFRLTGLAGGQTIDGVQAARFRGAQGSRGVGGGEGLVSIPLGELALLEVSGGHFIAEPYNRSFVLIDLQIPLSGFGPK